MSPAVGSCEQLRRLFDAYRRAVAEFTLASSELAKAVDCAGQEAFERHKKRWQQAREKCAALRREVNAHIQDHACWMV